MLFNNENPIVPNKLVVVVNKEMYEARLCRISDIRNHNNNRFPNIMDILIETKNGSGTQSVSFPKNENITELDQFFDILTQTYIENPTVVILKSDCYIGKIVYKLLDNMGYIKGFMHTSLDYTGDYPYKPHVILFNYTELTKRF